MTRHFIDISDLTDHDLRAIVDEARTRKDARKGLPKGQNDSDAPLADYALAMIFEKPSTRTRVSFDMGMRQLGGRPLLLRGDELQLGRGETIEDTAQVLSRMVDVIMIRTDDHEKLHGLADAGSIPVINGLTDDSHPCQILADILTYEEHKGPIKGAKIAWTGDGNNVATSWIEAAAAFDFELRLGCPDQLAPKAAAVEAARARGASIILTDKAEEAVDGADCVMADTWVSMGDDNAESRHNLLKPYQVDERLMGVARKDAIFMHCLPAHRGEEVTAAVIDGPQSVVFDEAENRLHAQKAILLWCLEKI